MTVLNMNGAEIDFDASVNLMDDDLREQLAAENFGSEQAYFSAYEQAHFEKYHEEWELSKANPVF